MWCAGKRPCVLLFRVPSPMEVLRQQAAGERVVTLFLTRAELSRRHSSQLVYMQGGQSHSKDPLEFTLHDLKHMEHFVNPDTHLEQVGFFKAMLGLGAPGEGAGPRAFFRSACRLDQTLWHELEYVISDMNTCISHLMGYLLAKLLFAAERKLAAACAAEDASNTCMHGCRCGAILAYTAADAPRPETAAASACPSEREVGGGGSEGGGGRRRKPPKCALRLCQPAYRPACKGLCAIRARRSLGHSSHRLRYAGGGASEESSARHARSCLPSPPAP